MFPIPLFWICLCEQIPQLRFIQERLHSSQRTEILSAMPAAVFPHFALFSTVCFLRWEWRLFVSFALCCTVMSQSHSRLGAAQVLIHFFWSSLLNGCDLVWIEKALPRFWMTVFGYAATCIEFCLLTSLLSASVYQRFREQSSHLLSFFPFFLQNCQNALEFLNDSKTEVAEDTKLIRTQEAARRIQCQCSNKEDSQS